jgi:heavy metal sensor kinase
MTNNSIKRRLIVTLIIAQALLAAGMLIVGAFYTRHLLISSLEASMQAHAMSVAALVRYDEDASGNVYFDDTLLPGSIDPAQPDLFAVWADRSGFLTESKNWPDDLHLAITVDGYANFRWQGVPYHAWRISRVPVLDREEGKAFQPQTLTIVYAAPMVRTEKQLQRAAIFIALASVILLLMTVLLALWGIRRGLLPLRELADRSAQVSANDWQLHLPEQIERVEELRPLTDSMSTMLERLQRSFEQQREFMGNAAHELKTPVAVLKSTLQSLLQRPRTSEQYREGLEQSLEDLERLERLLQWMLRLARAEQWAHGALRRDLAIIDVSATCEAAAERVRPLAESRHAQIRLNLNGRIPFRADPDDLQLVWTNLLENALRHTPEGGAVEVSMRHEGNSPAQIVFADHGPGVAPEDLPHIFERFYRGDPSRNRATGGFGLGLAIAKALIEAYGGTITVDSAPGRGTRMIVELPVEENKVESVPAALE